MNKLAWILALMMAGGIAGCSSTAVNYDMTHQLLVERVIKDVDVSSLCRDYVPVGGAVSLVTMSEAGQVPLPVEQMFEDGIIESLLNAGYRVCERSAPLVQSLINERTDSQYGVSVLPDAGLSAEPGHAGQNPVTGGGLDSAEYIIAYRLLECGIRTGPKPGSSATERSCRLRANIRIVDAGTGCVLNADTMDYVVNDELDAHEVSQAKDYHYSWYGHRYPQSGTSDK